MKKLLIALASVLMILSLCACSQKEKKVSSPMDFTDIGMQTMSIPPISGVSNATYAIIDKEIAQIKFVYSNAEFVYRGSHTAIPTKDMELKSTNVQETYSQTYEDVAYTITIYDQGLLVQWSKNAAQYCLYAPYLSKPDINMFGRVAASLVGIDVGPDTVTLPDITADTTAESMEQWLYDHYFTNVKWEYQSSTTVKKGRVISLSKVGDVHPYDEITVYVSTGPEEGDIILVPDNLCGTSEAEFCQKMEDLGMVPERQKTSYYATTIPIGAIYSYNDGLFPVGTTIKYNLSLGKYTFHAEDYVGKTQDQATQTAQYFSNLNGHVKISFQSIVTNDHKPGLTYDCSATVEGITTNVACKIAVQDTRVQLANYVGTYNNPCGSEHTSCSVGQIGFSIKYAYTGMPAGYITAQSVPAGLVPAGTVVTLTVSTSYPYLHRLDEGYYQKFEGKSFNETMKNLANNINALGGFNNVSWVSDTEMVGAQYGKILKIETIEGTYPTTDYKAGFYPPNQWIRVTIAGPQSFGG